MSVELGLMGEDGSGRATEPMMSLLSWFCRDAVTLIIPITLETDILFNRGSPSM